MKKLLLILILLAPVFLAAQQKFTLSGYVRDAANGETLVGANILLQQPGGQGTTSGGQREFAPVLARAGKGRFSIERLTAE